MSKATRVLHRVALDRVLPILGARRVDEITPADVASLVAELHGSGYRRETISKSVTYLAQTLDHAGASPNPARDKLHVKLPRDEREEHDPATAEHVEAVHRLLPPVHRLPLLWLDWSVSSARTVVISGYAPGYARFAPRRPSRPSRSAFLCGFGSVMRCGMGGAGLEPAATCV
jgi:hypothetical protein